MRVHTVNQETSYVIDPQAPRMNAELLGILTSRYEDSARRRHRFCFHQNPNVLLHDIVICYDNESYIPPNKHIGKVESLLVLKGKIEIYFFNDAGNVYDFRIIAAHDERLPFYIRIPENTWHGLRAIGGEPCIIKETIAGPYDRSSLVWAEFAPKEQEGVNAGKQWYENVFQQCKKNGIMPLQVEKFTQVSDTIFRSERQIVTVSMQQLEPIVESSRSSPSGRARLCCHVSETDKLQEMFIALQERVEIEESVHLKKDESLVVLKGKGRYIFPAEDGSQREMLQLSNLDSNKESDHHFFMRINRYISHKIKIDSPFVLIHEATTGPFRKQDTDYRIPTVENV